MELIGLAELQWGSCGEILLKSVLQSFAQAEAEWPLTSNRKLMHRINTSHIWSVLHDNEPKPAGEL